jgi:hypothetical protein
MRISKESDCIFSVPELDCRFQQTEREFADVCASAPPFLCWQRCVEERLQPAFSRANMAAAAASSSSSPSSSSSSSPSADFQHVLHQLRHHATTEVKLNCALSAQEVTLLCEALSVSSTHTAERTPCNKRSVSCREQATCFICVLAAVVNDWLRAFE